MSRRPSVVVAFYRTCVIDAVLNGSPAEFVPRRTVPAAHPQIAARHADPRTSAAPAVRPAGEDPAPDPQAVGLFLLAPLFGEYLVGNLKFSELAYVPFIAPRYGPGALLIPETEQGG